MADKVIDIPGVGPIEFPDSMTDAQVNAAATRLYQDKNPGAKQPPVTNWSDSSALTLAASAKAVPAVGNALYEFGTNPNVPKAAASVGRVLGGAAPAVGGIASGNPVAAVNGVLGASQGAWAGGKTGWFTGKLAQDMARPVAAALEKAAPYAQALSTASGAQGALDLAQMSDPKRQDIGFLGIGPSGAADPNHPAILNLLAMKATDAIKTLMKEASLSVTDAVKAYRALKAQAGS